MAAYRNRSAEKAERLVKLRDYLYANASPTHAVKMAEILAYLADKGHEVEIKTVYSDLKTLELFFDLDIQYDGRQKGYLLKNPPFKSYDLRLIVNSIQAAQFITQQEADRLTQEIMKLADEHTRPSLKRKTYVPNRVRTVDDSIMRNLDIIYEAIELDRKISYKCFRGANKEHTSRNYANIDGSNIITANPIDLIWFDNRYILFCSIKKLDGKSMCYPIPLKQIEQVTIHTEARRIGSDALKTYKKFQDSLKIMKKRIKGLTKNSTDLSSAIGRTRLRITIDQVFDVLEKFGDSALVIPLDDEFLLVSLDMYPTPEMYDWTTQLGIKILYPLNAESEFENYFSDLQNGIPAVPPIFSDDNSKVYDTFIQYLIKFQTLSL